VHWMKKKYLAVWAVTVLAISLIAGFISAEPQSSAQQTLQNIVIRPDGSVYPESASIQRSGNFYTLTNNIYGTIKILKSNIILSGAGHTLSGPYNGSQANVWVVGDGPSQSPDLVAEYIIGIDLGAETVEGVTIQSLNVKNFSIGMYMWTKNNTVSSNSISESILGVMLSGSNTTIINNHIANNKQGLFFGFNGEDALIPADIIISHNSFEENNVQINGCFCEDYPENEEPHAWDDGKAGNYWSDYNGIDDNGDGIGDTAYVIDVQNQDRCPLIDSLYQSPFPVPNITITLISVAFACLVLALATFIIALFLRNRKRQQLVGLR